MRLAIDAANFPRDRRGMGRVARSVVAAALADPTIELSLIPARRTDERALRAEFGPGFRFGGTFGALRRSAYDVVWFPWNGLRFRSAAPALVTMHDVFAFSEPHPERIARRREQAPMLRAAKRATAIVTDSEWSREQIVATLHVPRERTRVVAPFPGSFWSPGEGDVLPPEIPPHRYVLLVGARERRKNARMLLEACARALQPPAESLIIVGALQPEDREFVARSGLRAGEIAAGDDMLRALYRQAGVVAVPSTAEGFGLVPLEAMACGAPVLAADASALPETTGGGAMLLDPHDAGAWAIALRSVLDDPARALDLRARGAKRISGLERGDFARAMLALLRELAAA